MATGIAPFDMPGDIQLQFRSQRSVEQFFQSALITGGCVSPHVATFVNGLAGQFR